MLALNRYMRLSEAMYTPSSPTAKEFSTSSFSVLTRIAPVLLLIVPTLPLAFETNQIRPLKSGSAELIRSVAGSSAEVRS